MDDFGTFLIFLEQVQALGLGLEPALRISELS